MSEVRDRTVVITGAGSGIGQALAGVFAEAGAKLFLVDLFDESLAQTSATLADTCEVASMALDVRDEAQVRAMVDVCNQRFGGIDIYFNNAGVACSNLLWEQSAAESDWILDVNLRAFLIAVRVVVPQMMARGSGHIAATASLAGLNTSPTLGAYTISKHALVSACELLVQDLELAGADIRVSVLCPGPVPTNAHLAPGRPDRAPAVNPLVEQVEAFTGELMRNGMPPADVAAITLQGILRDDFWILPAKEFAVGALQRADRLRAAIEG